MHKLSKGLDGFLSRTLSGTVFTWREIMNLLIPGILDSLSITLINMLITALISKNGETSVAAVSLVGPISALVICLFTGISAGGTVIVAQYWGKNDPKQLRRAIATGFWLTIVVGLVVCLPLLLFPQEILQILYPEAEAAVMEKACTYMSGNVWSIVVFTVYTAAFAILRGLGKSKRCLALSIIINVAYLLFSILFLNLLNLDIQGSIWALLLARFVGTVAAVWLLFLWKAPVPMKLGELLVYDGMLLRSTLRVSIPFGLEQICISCGNLVAKMYMIPLGTTAISTHAIANSLLNVFNSPSLSAGNLAVTVVGRCIGAEKYDEAYTYGKRCNQIAFLLTALSAVVFLPLLPLLLRQYNPSPEAYKMARLLLLCSFPALLLFSPMSNTLPYTLRSGSDTMYPSVLSLVVLWLVSIAMGYVLSIPAGLGLWGIWIATWASWAVRTLGFYLRFRSKCWLYKTKKANT